MKAMQKKKAVQDYLKHRTSIIKIDIVPPPEDQDKDTQEQG